MSHRRSLPPSRSRGTAQILPNMIAIITEKPSVGLDIARVVGANIRKEGYCTGNGYMVTWALGHLVALAMPGAYGYNRTVAADLPMIPGTFKLVVRQIRTDRGMVTDIAAAKQLKVIDDVFSKCDSIIVATDAGREGELIFRYIYAYLGYTKPFRRLWISSLTDEAIREGMANLRDGREYDSLHAAADCRAKADWLVGMNASRALACVSGSPNSSIGRVQTPTLAMVCSRFKENRDFVSAPFWQLHVTLGKDGVHRRFFHAEDFNDKASADAAFSRVTSGASGRVTKAEKRRSERQPPLLYDLTALQKDCNVHHDMTAEKTLSVAQSLYEKKLISYPRTGSRYIPQDVMRTVPGLLKRVCAMKGFRSCGMSPDLSALNTRCVNDAKVTDHHALIVTGVSPAGISGDELTVYLMIAGRMLEAFSPPCVSETLLMEAEVCGMTFRSKSSSVVVPGWRAVFNRRDDRPDDEQDDDGSAIFSVGETAPVLGHGLARRRTMPRPLYTEATLLSAMESCGREVTDEKAREALREIGIGTPATRASIIATLVKRDYIRRSGKNIVPTDSGLALYEAVKEMLVADAGMTGSWENTLMQIERHTLEPSTFMDAITGYTRKATAEILGITMSVAPAHSRPCPKCGKGSVLIRAKTARCDNTACGLLVFRRFLNKELTDGHIGQLLSTGATGLIKGFKGKKGSPFDARLVFDRDFNVTISFPDKKYAGNR